MVLRPFFGSFGIEISMSTILNRLLAPLMDADKFFDIYWEREALWARESANRLNEWTVTAADIEDIAFSLTQCDRNWIRLMRSGKELPEAAYSTAEGLVSTRKVWQAYAAGYSMQLSKMHKLWAPIAGLCRTLESEILQAGVLLETRIGGHLYLTPAGH
jgi:hypothetical protein